MLFVKKKYEYLRDSQYIQGLAYSILDPGSQIPPLNF